MTENLETKSVFLCGSYHGNNLGDIAILDAWVSKLSDSILIRVMTKSPSETSRVLNRSEREIEFVNALKFFEILGAIRKSDRIIIGGGGLFFNYNFFDTLKMAGKSQLLVWVIITILGWVFCKPVDWIGIGAGPLSNFGKFITKFGGKFVRNICVRDKSSYKLLYDDLHIRKTIQTSDLVFVRRNSDEIRRAFESKNPDFQNKKLNMFVTFKPDVVNISRYIELVSKIKSDFSQINLKFFSTNPASDNFMNSEVAKEVGCEFIDCSNFTIDEFYKIFGQANIVLSMRLHALLIGMQEGALGIGITSELTNLNVSNEQNKVIQFQSDIYNSAEFAVEDLNYEKIAKGIRLILNDYEQITAVVVEKYEKYQEAALDNFISSS